MKTRFYLERILTYGPNRLPFIELVYTVNNFLKRNRPFYKDMEFIYREDEKLIIVLNPKVGSRTLIEEALRNPRHIIVKDLRKITRFPGDITVLIRDPYERFISFWEDKIRRSHKQYISLLRFKYSWFHDSISVNDFLLNIYAESRWAFEKHFLPQSCLIEYLSRFNRKVSLKNINFVSELLSVEKGQRNSTQSLVKAGTRDELARCRALFNKVYASDLNLQKYEDT